jgi:hypothetical protein
MSQIEFSVLRSSISALCSPFSARILTFPPSGLVRLRTIRPHQKLEWLESGSLPDLAQSFQRLSYLGVSLTIRNGEVSLPLYSERICKAVAELGPGPSSYILSGTPFLILCPLLNPSPARFPNQSYTPSISKESQGMRKYELLYWSKERNPDTIMEKEPFSILLFGLK